jgi:hypothetical protein
MVEPFIREDGSILFVTGTHFINYVKEKCGDEIALYVAQHFDWLCMAEANNRPELRQKAVAGLEAIGLGVE